MKSLDPYDMTGAAQEMELLRREAEDLELRSRQALDERRRAQEDAALDSALTATEQAAREVSASGGGLDEWARRQQLAGRTLRTTFDPARLTARSCCSSTEGDVHNRECQTPAARKQWGPAALRTQSERAPEAVTRVMRTIVERGFHVPFPIEVRVVAPDDAFISTALLTSSSRASNVSRSRESKWLKSKRSLSGDT